VRSYQVRFLPEAAEEFASLDKPIAERILKKLKWLAENFANLTPEPLGGELKGFFKLRVGSYRVLYSFDRERKTIYVHLVGRRRAIYKLP